MAFSNAMAMLDRSTVFIKTQVSHLVDKSRVKRWNTLDCRDSYIASNSKCTGTECSPTNRGKPHTTTRKNTYSSQNGRTVKQLHLETVYDPTWNWIWVVIWKQAHYLSDVTGSSTVKSVTCDCFVDTVYLPCAFAHIFMVQSHFWYRDLSMISIS